MDRASTSRLRGPRRLSIHATVALTIVCTGNGRSTNGSSSDTPKRPRKRPRRPETWKRAVAKAKRARGEEYLSPSTGETGLARKTGPACSCRLKCFERFSQNEKAVILLSFYKLGNKDLQDAHLFGLIHASAGDWNTDLTRHFFTSPRDINDYNKLSSLPSGRNSQSLTRKEVVLDLETVISSYAVATRPDFDAKNGTKGILFNRVSFVIPFKQTLF